MKLAVIAVGPWPSACIEHFTHAGSLGSKIQRNEERHMSLLQKVHSLDICVLIRGLPRQHTLEFLCLDYVTCKALCLFIFSFYCLYLSFLFVPWKVFHIACFEISVWKKRCIAICHCCRPCEIKSIGMLHCHNEMTSYSTLAILLHPTILTLWRNGQTLHFTFIF